MNSSRQNISCQCQKCHNCRARKGSRAALSAQRTAAVQAKAAAQSAPAREVAASPQKNTKAPTLERSFLSAFAANFKCLPSENGTVIPLEQQQGAGGCTLEHGVVTVPDDGFYMLLWELGVVYAQGGANLQLGINKEGAVLSEAIMPSYDSGQQVTWLCQGDQISLQLAGAGEQPEIHGNCARLTVLRMG